MTWKSAEKVPCPHCGWREGDGVKLCEYSATTGQTTHGNEHPTGLSPDQQSLYDAYLEYFGSAWISETERDRVIAETIAFRAALTARARSNAATYGWAIDPPEVVEEREKTWRERWMAEQMEIPLATQFPLESWCLKPFMSGKVYVYRRHKCGGHPEKPYGYRIRCTGCEVTIQLGEHGVDEDYG